MKRWGAVLGLLLAAGCGGDAGHPDTGVGAGQTPPAVPNCADFCARAADCFVALCDEDTMSTRYDGLASILEDQCNATCTDAQLQAAASPTSWQCFFEDSCRQVFGEDACHGMAHYSCS